MGCSYRLERMGKHGLVVNNNVFTCGTASGFTWDAICFTFLIVQKRIFGSYYFSYLVKEIKAQQVLASKGAELINEIQSREALEQDQAEKEVMTKIKSKMDRIRENQSKMNEMTSGGGVDVKYHYQGIKY